MARPKNVKELTPRLGHILRRLWPYTRNYRLLMTGSMLALMAEVFFRLLEPWMLALVLDHVIIQQSGASPDLPLVGEVAPMTVLILASVGLVLIVGLRSLTVYLSTVGFALVGNRVLSKVRGDLYRHLHELSMSFHTTARKGDLTVRVISDVGMLRDVLITAALPMLGNGLVLVGMVVVLFLLHWQLAALAMITVPLFLLTTLRLTDKIHKASREQRSREGSMASAAAESLGAIHIVKAMSLEERFGDAFSSENQRSLKQGVKGARLSARLGRTIDLLVATSTGIVLYFGATFVLNGQMTPGALVVFISYLKTAMRPMRDSAKYTGRLAKATAAGERILEVFDLEPEVRDLPGAMAAPRLQGRVCFEDVTFGYQPGRPVVNGVSISVEPGERVALVGPSGSGKSTLLNLLLRLYDPVSGRVTVDGRDVREYTLASLRSQIGVVLQETTLFAASISDNIAYGKPGATQEEIEHAAGVANAHDFILAMPDGYDTVVGERGVTISGGERQRIAIARAALRRAAILVLDEPTTGLDDENAQQVSEALERLAGRCTTFLVTHDLRQVSRSDRVIRLEAGRLAGSELPTRLVGGA
jgi:ATP-binding cassette, subfamily B, bacterial